MSMSVYAYLARFNRYNQGSANTLQHPRVPHLLRSRIIAATAAARVMLLFVLQLFLETSANEGHERTNDAANVHPRSLARAASLSREMRGKYSQNE